MKRLVLMMIPALICGAVFTGCSEKEPNGEKTVDGLYVIGSKSATVPANGKSDLVFTGADIVSYNVTNGEFVFTEEKMDAIISRVSLHAVLHFFIDDRPVFDPPIRIHLGWGLSYDDFDLQFRTDGERIFLTDIYQSLDSVPEAELGMMQQMMDAKKEKRKTELDVLIAYLSETGKVIDRETTIPVASSECEIIVFMDSLHLVNWEINGTNITAVYPAGTDLSSIEPFIIVSDYATVSPKSGEKMDFSNGKEVTYTVKSEDGTVKVYKAKATVHIVETNYPATDRTGFVTFGANYHIINCHSKESAAYNSTMLNKTTINIIFQI